jgi:uncharacterized membrane protein YbaN (DUF454 family)
MLRYSLVYGGIAGTIILVMIVLAIIFGTGPFSHSLVLGYLVMLVVLSLIFVGVKRYRDMEKGGVIRFLPALGLGLGIAVVAGIAYVLAWEIYLAATHYAFMDDYFGGMIASIRAKGGADMARKIAEVEAMRTSYANPLYRVPETFLEIFPVGLLVAIVSAALLRNPRVLPARAPA